MTGSEPTAIELAADLVAGRVTALEVADACLARIEADEPRVQAFAHLDADHARAQARALDEGRRAGKPAGPLFGLPVGLKDIFDTADYPTECGTVVLTGRRPRRDGAVAARLRAAGAVIIGKTVTTELACFAPGKTRNPHDPGRTPGGSSSGSAAAVAAHMVPLAVGSQTNGSVIRPASFCGTYGLKPSFGLISRAGCLTTSRNLDHVGVFARTIDDLALLAAALAGHDAEDAATSMTPPPPLRRLASEAPPVPPRLAFVRGPTWDQAEPATHAAFAELMEVLGATATAVDLPVTFADAIGIHRTIWTTELAFHLASLSERGRDRLSPQLMELIEAGRSAGAVAYLEALAARDRLAESLEGLLAEYDAIVTPAAPGEAPVGLEATGSPAFCSLWTLTGLPAVSLPILQGPSGLPLGCQLVGGRGDDARLLRVARWLAQRVTGDLMETSA